MTLHFIYIYFVRIFLLFFMKTFVFLSFSFLFSMKHRIYATEYQPIRNRNRWSEIVSGTVCFIPLENARKPLFSWRFHGVWSGNIGQKRVKSFGRVGHIDLPHNGVFWKLFCHILSFLNGKRLLIHFNRNLSSEWVP